MDPVELIIQALMVGVSTSATTAVGEAARDSSIRLREILKRKFRQTDDKSEHKHASQDIMDNFINSPSEFMEAIKGAIVAANIQNDKEIIKLVKKAIRLHDQVKTDSISQVIDNRSANIENQAIINQVENLSMGKPVKE